MKRITDAKTFGKIISKESDKIDFGNVYCCKNVRKCRQRTVLEKDIVFFDDGSRMCPECASKIISPLKRS